MGHQIVNLDKLAEAQGTDAAHPSTPRGVNPSPRDNGSSPTKEPSSSSATTAKKTTRFPNGPVQSKYTVEMLRARGVIIAPHSDEGFILPTGQGAPPPSDE
jgi:hypothetical protein